MMSTWTRNADGFELNGTKSPDGVTLVLEHNPTVHQSGGNPRHLTVDVKVTHPARIRLSRDHLIGRNWAMVAGLHPRAGKDPFLEVVRRIFRIKKREDSEADAMRRVFAVVRDFAIHAANHCSAIERHAALRFSPPVRFRIYSALLADQTGRLFQCAQTCPGVLLFAIALRERGSNGRQAARELLDGVVAGRRIDHLLDDAIDFWISEVEDDSISANWARLQLATQADTTRLRLEQRLLIKRAGPWVSPTLLWLPPPLAWAAEDIPMGVYSNARWFKVMKRPEFRYAEPSTVATRTGLARCASKSSSSYYNALRLDMLYQMLDYLKDTQRVPNRKTHFTRLLCDALAWHQDVGRTDDLAPMIGQMEVSRELPDKPLTVPLLNDVLPYNEAGISIEPITDSITLLDEGVIMQHCVGGRLSEALLGSKLYFKAIIGDERLTVELTASPDRTLSEVRGPRNAKPSNSALRKLQQWLSSVYSQSSIAISSAGSARAERSVIQRSH